MNDWWVDVPAERAMPAARRAAERAQLEALATRPARSRSRGPILLAAGGLALASATGAAFAVFGSDQATNRLEVRCHTTVEVARGVDFAGVGFEMRDAVEQGAGISGVSIDRAITECADLWRQGVLRPGAPNAMPLTNEVEEVPPLTACLTEDGIAAVFPTELDVCASLGLRGLKQ